MSSHVYKSSPACQDRYRRFHIRQNCNALPDSRQRRPIVVVLSVFCIDLGVSARLYCSCRSNEKFRLGETIYGWCNVPPKTLLRQNFQIWWFDEQQCEKDVYNVWLALLLNKLTDSRTRLDLVPTQMWNLYFFLNNTIKPVGSKSISSAF